jgi:transcriptional regulator with XRE-family HTH domain
MGAGARELRIDAGVTLEEVASAAQRYGLRWTSGRVGDFEAGRTAPNLPTLVAAVAALGETIGRQVSLAELVTGRGQVQINDNLSLEKSQLRRVLSGESVRFPIPMSSAIITTANKMINKQASTARWPPLLRAVSPDFRLSVLEDFRESDSRMCKNLGVDPVLGAAAMAALWGHPFTVERDHRAGPKANAQRRGQISRQLKAELEQVINDGNH